MSYRPTDDVLLEQDIAKRLCELCFKHFDDWPIKSAAAFRNAILGKESTLLINPLLTLKEGPDTQFVRYHIHETVADGCMIDFGYIPNEIIIAESVRARQPFEAGEMLHPYDRWLGITAWEGGMNGYLVFNDPADRNIITVFELYGVSVPNAHDVVILYDMVRLQINGALNTLISPVYMKSPEMMTEVEIRKRGSNSLDPLVMMLRMLADASIPIEDHPAPERLNRQRAKQGKFQIPAHTVVDTSSYVRDYSTAVKHRYDEKSSKGGHHASPVAHWRRAHTRTLQSGQVVPVRSTKVNWRGVDDFHRLFYRIKDDRG